MFMFSTEYVCNLNALIFILQGDVLAAQLDYIGAVNECLLIIQLQVCLYNERSCRRHLNRVYLSYEYLALFT